MSQVQAATRDATLPAEAMPEQSATIPAIDPAARTMLPDRDGPAGAAPSDPYIGALLKDSYRIERLLGAGGMGAVYLAEHATLRRRVAVKILAAEFAPRPELKQRFLREARAAAAIRDDHVVEIYDFGEAPDGAAFIAMEYLEGEDLAALLDREGRLSWPRARDIAVQICQALQAAHDRGIVHRDVKPANCFCIERQRIKVLDFGIAKVRDPDAEVGRELTRSGAIFGTPEYMSPEQARGEAHDHRVDIYALGVIVFRMLTGRLPFVGSTFMGLLRQHMYEPPPRPADVTPGAAIPAGAEAVVLKALQKDPALRFGSMAEMAAALVAVDAGRVPEVTAELLPATPPGATRFRTGEGSLPPVAEARRVTGRRWLWLGGFVTALVVTLAVMLRGAEREAVVVQVPAAPEPVAPAERPSAAPSAPTQPPEPRVPVVAAEEAPPVSVEEAPAKPNKAGGRRPAAAVGSGEKPVEKPAPPEQPATVEKPAKPSTSPDLISPFNH
jgi:predicted Ser/Thr protein kinase